MGYREIKFSTRNAAQAFSDDVDKAAGYPADGVNVGQGRHVSKEAGRTLTASEIVPSGNEFAYVVHREVEQYEDRVISKNGQNVTISFSAGTTLKKIPRPTIEDNAAAVENAKKAGRGDPKKP
jgi:hypothetical protein